MRALVQLQRIFVAKVLATFTAAKRFFSCVDNLVSDQSILSRKGFITIIALKRLVTRVAALVCFELTLKAKVYIAVLAFMGSVTVENTTLVYVQRTFLCKMFMTSIALIRLLTGVDTQVCFQVVLYGKAFRT